MKCKNCKNVVPKRHHEIQREFGTHVRCIVRKGAWFHPESDWQCSDYEHNGEVAEDEELDLWKN